MVLSNSEVDRLGDRLREGVTPEDRDRYFDWREELSEPLANVQTSIQGDLGYEVTLRRKTLDSTVAKLERETIRLSQVQDIAGCRTVLGDLAAQDRAVTQISEFFQGAHIDDLRDDPHNGYRAVHVIVAVSGAKLVEVQVRTELQHVWAQLSEKLADRFGVDVKYGGGPAAVRSQLQRMSRWVQERDSEGATPFDRGIFGDLAAFMARMQVPEDD